MASEEERQPLVQSGGTYQDKRTNYATTTVDDSAITPRGSSQRPSLTHILERSTTHDISLSWRNISVTVTVPGKKSFFGGKSIPPLQKLILQNVSGITKSGSLIAIMGASGSGKSTLLNVLTSRNTMDYTITGDVMLNGCPLTSDAIRNISAYVQQHDLFFPMLTVREQLQFRALLRMDKKMNRIARMNRVEQVIQEMGLDGCSSNRIGTAGGTKRSISGGERKRLAFASEALTNPPIFFCDEPTSSLDSFMAQNIVKTLKKMASRGHSVLCTIHQPSSELFELFNHVVLLSQGRLAFMGTKEESMAFFTRLNYPCPRNFNPADHFILTLAIVPGKEEESSKRSNGICDAFQETVAYKAIEQEIGELASLSNKENDLALKEVTQDSRYNSSTATQMSQLFWRAWVTQFRDLRLFGVRIMQSVVVGVILSLVYLQVDTDQKGVLNISGSLFLIVTFTTSNHYFSNIPVFCDDIPIFMREYGSSLYRIDTYYITKSLAEVPMFSGVSILFITMTYWMVGYEDDATKFLLAMATTVLTAATAIALSYVVATLSGNMEVALTIAFPMYMPFMLFSGMLINTDSIPDYFLPVKKIVWLQYSFEVLMVEEWKDVDNIPCDNKTITNPNITLEELCEAQACLYPDGDSVLDYYSMDKDDVGVDFIYIAVIGIGFYFIGYCILAYRARKSRE